MAEVKYSGINRGDDNRFKVNNNILRMMQANPALGTGYLIGSMLGENYWGKKRAKSEREADKRGRNGNGSASSNGSANDWTSRNSALEEYRNNPNGRTLYSGSSVQTPQQANKPAVTTENAGNGGGVPSVADAWNSMNNANVYNPGNTGLYTNGPRDLGNVMYSGRPAAEPANSALAAYNSSPNGNVLYSGTGNNGGSSNPGVYIDTARGIYPSSPRDTRPAGPAPYTDDQLRQIQGQNFTAEELAKMASPQELARMVVMARGGAPTAASQVAQGQPSGYVPQGAAPASGVDRAVQQAANDAAATNTPIVADAVPDAANLRIHGNTGQGGGGQTFGPAPEYVDPAQNLAVSNNPYAGYGYGVSEQGLFNGSAVDRYQEYLRNLQRDASGNF